mgnify:CR=1 FL=1
MTIQDAEYLEFSTYVDYSEPKISFITGKLIDDTKVIAEEWLLKPQYIPARVTRSGGNDLTYNRRSVVVVGTSLILVKSGQLLVKEFEVKSINLTIFSL